jgi:hypothetical protein
MKRLIVAIGVIVLTTATIAHAQQPVAPGDPHHPPGQTQPPAPSGQPTPTPATGMMPMMEMCREMMSGQSAMGPGMMGGGQPSDPKMMAEMMEMRGEMMKAMGDIMMKHAKKMRGASSATK